MACQLISLKKTTMLHFAWEESGLEGDISKNK
jgi:hypothetical protein